MEVPREVTKACYKGGNLLYPIQVFFKLKILPPFIY